MTCEFDRRELHAETDAQVGHLVLARVTDRGNLALRATHAEAAGHEDAVAGALFDGGSQGVQFDRDAVVTHFPPGADLARVRELVLEKLA